MAGQPLVITFSSAVDETALKCGDPFYKDFPKYIYQQAVYRAERSIAQEYKILDRIMRLTNTAGTSPFTINRQNFSGQVWRLTVQHYSSTGGGVPVPDPIPRNAPNATGQVLGTAELYHQRQVDEVLDNVTSVTASSNYFYALIFNTNAYSLFYTHPAENDVIEIYYTATIAGQEDYDTLDENGDANVLPAIPNEYFEETVRRAIRYMVKLGIAKYETGEKAQRYSRLLSIYTRRTDETEDFSLGRDRAWIQIKPFQYP
jgi:hypothetical protein